MNADTHPPKSDNPSPSRGLEALAGQANGTDSSTEFEAAVQHALEKELGDTPGIIAAKDWILQSHRKVVEGEKAKAAERTWADLTDNEKKVWLHRSDYDKRIAKAATEARIDELDNLPLRWDTEVHGTRLRIYGYSAKAKRQRLAELQQDDKSNHDLDYREHGRTTSFLEGGV